MSTQLSHNKDHFTLILKESNMKTEILSLLAAIVSKQLQFVGYAISRQNCRQNVVFYNENIA